LTTKYPIKVAHKLYPAGTQLRQATLEEMQQIWPGITVKPASVAVGVWFPQMTVPTIVHRSQLELSTG